MPKYNHLIYAAILVEVNLATLSSALVAYN